MKYLPLLLTLLLSLNANASASSAAATSEEERGYILELIAHHTRAPEENPIWSREFVLKNGDHIVRTPSSMQYVSKPLPAIFNGVRPMCESTNRTDWGQEKQIVGHSIYAGMETGEHDVWLRMILTCDEFANELSFTHLYDNKPGGWHAAFYSPTDIILEHFPDRIVISQVGTGTATHTGTYELTSKISVTPDMAYDTFVLRLVAAGFILPKDIKL